jgi:LysR family transcriptional activator of dmlA
MCWQTIRATQEQMKLRTDLTFFSTLIKCGSLSAAAREYDVTPSAVSKWLAQLEARLGVRLIARNTRRISLTNEGEIYLAEGRRILGEIDDLERSISSSQAAPIGLLKVHATLGFGRAFVAPAISKFSALYPDLEIQLFLTDRSVSLAEGAVDVAVRFGPPPDGRGHGAQDRQPSAARLCFTAVPERACPAGGAARPDDAQLPDRAPGRCGLWQWHFTKGPQTQTVKVRGTLSSNDGAAVLTWALQGHGVLMRSEWDAAPFVRSGDLEVLLDDYALPNADIYAVYPQKQNLAAKVRVFVDFLTTHFAQAAGKERLRW